MVSDPLVMKRRRHGGSVPCRAWTADSRGRHDPTGWIAVLGPPRSRSAPFEHPPCEGRRVDADVTAAIDRLADAGFDLVHAFDAAAAAREPGWEFLADGALRVGLLVCNTRALWPRFVAAMRDPAVAAEPDPLDHFTERTIEAAFPGAPIYFGHRADGSGAFLPFTRLAVATGLGALAASHLVIHPTYGPWFALRAVVLVAGKPPVRAPLRSPCSCGPGCKTALASALASTSWEAWLAVRDACGLRVWRYSDEQARYHYTKEWIPPVESP